MLTIAWMLVGVAAPEVHGVEPRATVVRRQVPRPRGKLPLKGPLPRPILLTQVLVNYDFPGQRADTRTEYHVYDTAAPEAGFRKVFEAPGSDQYCRFLTPLYGGCGVAMGQVSRTGRKSDRRLFWFDLLGDGPGAKIATHPWEEWTRGRELRFRGTTDANADRGEIHCFDVVSGKLRSFSGAVSWVSVDTLLGIDKVGGKDRTVLIDVVNETLADFGAAQRPWLRDDFEGQIYPAGPKARDGVYYVQSRPLGLWYKPPDCRWVRVVSNARVLKLHGGFREWLPVGYVGDRRFAVARTVDSSTFEAAEAVTMLVDGMTGRVLEKTDPEAYDYAPELKIPEGWWSEELAALRRKRRDERQPAKLFEYDRKLRLYTHAGGKSVKVGDDHGVALSNDGSRLVVYTNTAKGQWPRVELTFSFVDGKSLKPAPVKLAIRAEKASTSKVAWLVLALSDPATTPEFTPAARDLWWDPWR